MSFIAIIFVVALAGCNFVGLFALLATGLPANAPYTFANAFVVLCLVTVVWVRALRGTAVGAIGLPLLVITLLMNGGILVYLWRNVAVNRAALDGVRVVSLTERPIRWPGIAGPVGVSLEVVLEHDLPADGRLYSPRVTMGAAAVPSAAERYDLPYAATLRVPPCNESGLNRPPYSPAHLVYDLYPSSVSAVVFGESICFFEDRENVQTSLPELVSPGQLRAAWPMSRGWGQGRIDLSAVLTIALQKSSALQGNPDAWRGMLEGLKPSALQAAGYRSCSARCKVGTTDNCYCAPKQERDELLP